MKSKGEKLALLLARACQRGMCLRLLQARPPKLVSILSDNYLQNRKRHIMTHLFNYHLRFLSKFKRLPRHGHSLSYKNSEIVEKGQVVSLGSKYRGEMTALVNLFRPWMRLLRARRESVVESYQNTAIPNGERHAQDIAFDVMRDLQSNPSLGVEHPATARTADKKAVANYMGSLRYSTVHRASPFSKFNGALLSSRFSTSIITVDDNSVDAKSNQENNGLSKDSLYFEDAIGFRKKRKEQYLSRFLKAQGAVLSPIVHILFKRSIKRSEQDEQRGTCSLSRGFVDFLCCTSRSAVIVIQNKAKLLRELIRKYLLLIKDFIIRQCNNALQIYRKLIQSNSTLTFRHVFSIIFGEHSRDESHSFNLTKKGYHKHHRLNTTGSSVIDPKNQTLNRGDREKLLGGFSLISSRNSHPEKEIKYQNKPKSIKIREKQGSNHWSIWQGVKRHDAYNINIHSQLKPFVYINDTRVQTARKLFSEPSPKEKLGKFISLVESAAEKSYLQYREVAPFTPEGSAMRRRLPRHARIKTPNKTERPKIASQPVREDARAMTRRLLELMTLAKNLHPKLPHSSAKKADEDYEYDIGSISHDELSGGIEADSLRDNKPTQADRQLLENIERLTFLVLGRDSDLNKVQGSTAQKPRFGKKTYPGEDRTGDAVYGRPKPYTLADKRRRLKSQRRRYNGATKKKDSTVIARGLRGDARRDGTKEKPLELNRRYKWDPKDGGVPHKKKYRRKNRRQRDVLPLVEAHKRRGSFVTMSIPKKPGRRILPQRVQVRTSKATKHVRPPTKFKTTHRQIRSVDTIELMDDFRLAWPSLRTKANSLVNKISNLKSTYDAATDELTRLVAMGDGYRKDATIVAARDKEATAKLKTETAKLKIAERKFENFQKQIADEEKLNMDYERKAFKPLKKFVKEPASLLAETLTIPEKKARVTLNDITHVGHVLSVPMPEYYLQTLPLEGNKRAGLESTLLALKPVNKHRHDENLHKVASDLSEISSRAQMNIKSPERYHRSAETKQNIAAGPEVHGQRVKKSDRKTQAVEKSLRKTGKGNPDTKEKRNGKSVRLKRATTTKGDNIAKLIRCKPKQLEINKASQPTSKDRLKTSNQETKPSPPRSNLKGSPNVREQQEKPTIYNQQKTLGADNIEYKPPKSAPNVKSIQEKPDSEKQELGSNLQKGGPNIRKGQRIVENDQFDFINRQHVKNLPDKTSADDLKHKGKQAELGKSKPNADIYKEKIKDEDADLMIKPKVKNELQRIIDEQRNLRPDPGVEFQPEKRKDLQPVAKPKVNTEQERRKIEDSGLKIRPVQQEKIKEEDLNMRAEQSQQVKRKDEGLNIKSKANIENQGAAKRKDQDVIKSKSNVKNQQEKMAAEDLEARIMADINKQQERKAAEESVLKDKLKVKDKQAKTPESPNLQREKIASKEMGPKKKTKEIEQLEKELKDTNLELDKLAAQELNLKSKPHVKDEQEIKPETSNVQLEKTAAEEFDRKNKPSVKDQKLTKAENPNVKLDKMAAEEFDLKNKQNVKNQQQKKEENSNLKLDKLAADQLDIINQPYVLKEKESLIPEDFNVKIKPKVSKTMAKADSEDFDLGMKPSIINQQERTDSSGVDMNIPELLPKITEDVSLPELKYRRKRDEKENSTSPPLTRTRRRVLDFKDASFVSEPDVDHVVVGFHGLNYRGDQHDVLDSNEEDTDEEDTLLDEGGYGGVEEDSDDMDDENLLGLGLEGEDYDDCIEDYEDFDFGEDDGYPGEKRVEDIAPAEDLARAHAVKMWDDVGADIQLYAAPDRDTPEEIMGYEDPVVAAEHGHVDQIGTGKDMVNELEAELNTPKHDPVIEGLMAPGVRQDERDTVREARLLDAIPSLNTIEDVSGVLKAAGRDLQQELRMRDVGVDVDRLLNQGDLDPYNELIGDTTSDMLNEKYIEFFGRNSLSAPVQKELRDIVNTRQKADKAFRTLRKSESLVDESILPAHVKNALDEQLDDSIQSIRREQKKQELRGKIFDREDQENEADAIKELEQNNEALIDQRLRQTEQLEEDLKAAASDQVEMAARRSKMLHDLAVEAG